MNSSAIFSRNKKYRYVLERIWDDQLPAVMIIGLNPSTADAEHNDPTIYKCIKLAKFWGFGSLVMVNLFAFKATDPKDLLKAEDPVGKRNTWYIRKYLKEVDVVVGAWGNHGVHRGRAYRVMRWLPPFKVIGVNKSGMPVHPLYQKDGSLLIDFHKAG